MVRASLRRATVIIEEPTEPRTSANAADISFPYGGTLDQFVLKPLVIALTVVVLDVFGHRSAEMTFAERDHAVQTLL